MTTIQWYEATSMYGYTFYHTPVLELLNEFGKTHCAFFLTRYLPYSPDKDIAFYKYIFPDHSLSLSDCYADFLNCYRVNKTELHDKLRTLLIEYNDEYGCVVRVIDTVVKVFDDESSLEAARSRVDEYTRLLQEEARRRLNGDCHDNPRFYP